MWRRACPLVTGVLVAGLIITRRRLSAAQTELDHLRAVARNAAVSAPEPLAAKPETTSDRAPATGAVQARDAAAGAAELSSEWEQAVPPMDS
jgi:hypothetical protein